ncbi:MAG: acyl-CoA dehydrogenase family protein [Planctomycetota bacterium]
MSSDENFFTDNEDLVDYFDNMDIRRLVALQERNYSRDPDCEYAPEGYEDAKDSYRRVLEVLGDICANFIAPRATEVDDEGVHLEDGRVHYAEGTRESLDRLAQADMMGFTLPREYGGLNFPVLVYSMAIELVSRADASLMNLFGLQDIAETVESFGDEELKDHYLPKFADGDVTGAMALTEPDAGSDLTNVQLRATYDDEAECWRLNGVKRFITNGCADVLLVLARSEPDSDGARGLSLFLCESHPSLQVRRLEDKLGIHGSPTCELQFNNVPAYLIGRRKRGLTKYVLSLMNGARLGVAAQGVGIAQAAFSDALEFAEERVQFGQSIRMFPAVRRMLGRMHMKVETARLLLYEASKIVDMHDNMNELYDEDTELDGFPSGKDLRRKSKHYRRLASALTPMVKYYATEICNEVCYDAIQVMGGSGYMKDYDVERYYRDARITTIYEGTTEIQYNAALRYIVNGFLEDRFEELHKEHEGSQPWMLKRLEEAREHLQEAVDYANNEDEDFLNLNASRLVESATHIYNGYLLLDPAGRSEHKHALAQNFISEVLPNVLFLCNQVRGGDRTYLDRMEDLLDYE